MLVAVSQQGYLGFEIVDCVDNEIRIAREQLVSITVSIKSNYRFDDNMWSDIVAVILERLDFGNTDITSGATDVDSSDESVTWSKSITLIRLIMEREQHDHSPAAYATSTNNNDERVSNALHALFPKECIISGELLLNEAFVIFIGSWWVRG